MTFVGKILVIVILVFALFFLALTTVVFTTTENWKDKATDNAKKIAELNTDVTNANSAAAARTKDLADAKKQHADEVAKLKVQLNDLTTARNATQVELDKFRTELETSLETMKTSLAASEASATEANNLRSLLAAVQKQANEFKDQQRQLNDDIFELRRQLQDATNRSRNLQERVASLNQVIQANNLTAAVGTGPGAGAGAGPGDPRSASTGLPDTLQAKITRVNARNDEVEFDAGSDDGVSVGSRLQVFRLTPRPEYLGQIEVLSVDPDHAVARVVNGGTRNGKRIQEGDDVAPKIRPRG